MVKSAAKKLATKGAAVPMPAPLLAPPADPERFEAHVARVFDAYHAKYKSGRREALLDALHFGLQFNVLFPEWVRLEAGFALMQFDMWISLSLDEAFGIRRSRDPRRVRAERDAIKKAGDVTAYIYTQMRSGRSRNEELFEEVGEKFSISAVKVKQYWLRGNAALGLNTPKRRRAKG